MFQEKPDPMVRMDSVASTQELTFPDKLAGVIIGKSGWRLKSLQDRTRTKIILKDLMEKVSQNSQPRHAAHSCQFVCNMQSRKGCWVVGRLHSSRQSVSLHEG